MAEKPWTCVRGFVAEDCMYITMERRVEELRSLQARRRPMANDNLIVQTADTCAGSWRINRRRIRVVDILRAFTCPPGYAVVREDYPELSDAEIEAALIFAQEHIDNDRI